MDEVLPVDWLTGRNYNVDFALHKDWYKIFYKTLSKIIYVPQCAQEVE